MALTLVTKYESYSGRYWKVGGTWGVVIPPHVRQALGLHPGDLMLMSVWGPLIIMRKAGRKLVFAGDSIPVSAIPGPKVELPDNAGLPEDSD